MNLESASIGIIGGADGPTAIILSGNAAVLAQVLMVMAAAWIGYLLGSLMFGIIVSKCLYHDDVRNHGSGNAGMTNILRTYGKGAAALTLIGDMGKGFLAVWLARMEAGLMLGMTPGMAAVAFGPDGFNVGAVAAVAALLGHHKPLYFRFKGGKGVAVGAGAVLASSPQVFAALVVLFIVIVACSRIVSLASIICAACYPVFTLVYCLLTHNQNVLFSTVCAALMGGLVIWMHRENIQRLRNGTEYRFGEKKK